jgi:4-hydroxybenzoate polyprenyltransferase
MERSLVGLRGWIEASHPFPLSAVVFLTGLGAVASAEGDDLDLGRLVLVLLAMLLSQLAIGWTNDYVDRESDRRVQPSKPIASGRVDARKMPVAIAAVLLGAFVIGVALGPLPLLFLAIGTAAGLSYDLWLKQSVWSWAPYVVAFCVLPPYVWTSLDLYRPELLGIYAIALPLAPAVHIANVLPDIEADAATGRRNLALTLGRARALRVIAICLLQALVLAVLLSPVIDYDATLLGATVLVYLVILGVAAVCYLRRLDVMAFRAVVVAAVLFAGGWLAAV